ncbi:hypothetical protein B0T24DRAFT_630439 [Lasiosphaeria ovina]|uniref:Subtilisin-like serine protease n=1 Tax=Lasiosphaeria ovina TaxID=92902 RepID=A0AAE0N6C3_9PEZI|nr:hypothetical protein B0T24DRAFT_630439 [Lasiosphaeria ovina]
MAASENALLAEPPFPAARQLCADLDDDDQSKPANRVASRHLPGDPRVLCKDGPGVLEFLEKEYCSADMDRVASKLWWMSKQDSANISPLHRQFVKRRNIVVTEDPKLHLVWIQDRIFVKPLPRYLTSYAFWRDHLGKAGSSSVQTRSRSRIRKAALGYLRTYFHLVRSESDFRIAQDPALCLITAGVTWEQFCGFAHHLAGVADRDVGERYAYGEIRLTRLNFYAPLLLGKLHFQRVEYQNGAYFASFYGPILFVIGIASIILNGFQVAIAADQVHPLRNDEALSSAALWVGVVMILSFWAVFLFLSSLFVYKVAAEWTYAIRDRLRLRSESRTTAPPSNV